MATEAVMQEAVEILTAQERERAQPSHGPAIHEVTQDADMAHVRSLAQDNGVLAPHALTGTGFTYRHDWGDRHGQCILNLNWGALTDDSRVFVALSEGRAFGVRFIGAARYTVHNVAPHRGGVDIWVNIEWGSDIRLYVDYLVVNP